MIMGCRSGGNASLLGWFEGVGRRYRGIVYSKPSYLARPLVSTFDPTTSLASPFVPQMINSTTPLTGPRQLNPFPSVFSTTSVKPALGLSFTYTSDVTLLLQRTGEVFDQDDRERKDGAGRSVVEVLKNKFGVSRIDPFFIHVEWWRMG